MERKNNGAEIIAKSLSGRKRKADVRSWKRNSISDLRLDTFCVFRNVPSVRGLIISPRMNDGPDDDLCEGTAERVSMEKAAFEKKYKDFLKAM